MQASAGFVSASALGMACGPAMACLLQTDFRIYKLTMNQDTLPGWVMAIAWLVYLLCLCLCFEEPGNLLSYEAETGKVPCIHFLIFYAKLRFCSDFINFLTLPLNVFCIFL
jgi:hypothetical protein